MFYATIRNITKISSGVFLYGRNKSSSFPNRYSSYTWIDRMENTFNGTRLWSSSSISREIAYVIPFLWLDGRGRQLNFLSPSPYYFRWNVNCFVETFYDQKNIYSTFCKPVASNFRYSLATKNHHLTSSTSSAEFFYSWRPATVSFLSHFHSHL